MRLLAANLVVTSARAERELGVEFRPLEKTLTDCLARMRTRQPATVEAR